MIDFKATKQRTRDDLKQTILSHARSLIQDYGTHKFSMRKLATELKCSPGTLYLYFKNKEEIVNSLVNTAFEELSQQLKLIKQEQAQPLNYLKQLMRAYIEFGLEHHEHYQFAFMTKRSNSKGPYKPHDAFEILSDTVKSCVDEKLFHCNDIQLISQTLWAGIHGITSLFIVLPTFPWLDQDKLIQHQIDTLITGNLASNKTDDKR